MSSTIPPQSHRKALIGSPSNFWAYSSESGFDLTHPSTPSIPSSGPKHTIQTTTEPITIDPSKSALVVIDMQNFFLSEAFGRGKGAGHAACENLVKYAVPAARKAGIRVVWLNWGLTDEEVKDMPPAVKRAFGFFAIPAESEFKGGAEAFGEHEGSVSVDRHGEENETMYRGIGADCGKLTFPDGRTVQGGGLLMRGAWNSALYPPLDAMFEQGAKIREKPDVWIHKNRMSGMWGATTPLKEFLDKEGIRTLFFTGVNTDQCVGGTLTDAFSNGYDCVLLGDGCGTTTPEYAQQCWEYNASRTFGFCTGCEEFAKGVGGT
ncbi:Isochorismatase hydrolase [Clathrospora elynae]|uniref:Isochorismatase hydrolase n=1 Tax=Clathrospora elynae TaxID=706981 RepID=A0A6A5S6B2_9PLEO|nr:Isochorismatase hydrolase [Clathrospora elynae]